MTNSTATPLPDALASRLVRPTEPLVGPGRPAPRVVAVIPAFREERHIAGVVRGARPWVDEVWVIDDGSPDRTAEVAAEAGAEVIRHEKNSGKGAAIKTGLLAMLRRGATYVILLDGDGQHAPAEIPRFLEAAERDGAGFVIGNRFGDVSSMPWLRRGVNRYMSRRISRLAGTQLADTQCGFRLLRADIIPRVLGESDRFDFETEMIFLAAESGCRISNAPISTIYGEERSKIDPWHDTIRFFQLTRRWKHRLKATRAKAAKEPSAGTLELTADTRLMIFAPHPDDEVLAAGGLLQQARAVGASVHVVFVTDGDNNPWPQRWLERRWFIDAAGRRRWGDRRRSESKRSLAAVGCADATMTFLALPDQGVGGLWDRRDPATLKAFQNVLTEGKPNMVLLPSAADRHPDHRATFAWVQEASRRTNLKAAAYSYLIHPGLFGQPARGLHHSLTETQRAAKYQAILCHETQISLSRKRFLGYATGTEVFTPINW